MAKYNKRGGMKRPPVVYIGNASFGSTPHLAGKVRQTLHEIFSTS